MRVQGTEQIIRTYIQNRSSKVQGKKRFFGHQSVLTRLIQSVILYRVYLFIYFFLSTAALLHRKSAYATTYREITRGQTR